MKWSLRGAHQSLMISLELRGCSVDSKVVCCKWRCAISHGRDASLRSNCLINFSLNLGANRFNQIKSIFDEFLSIELL